MGITTTSGSQKTEDYSKTLAALNSLISNKFQLQNRHHVPSHNMEQMWSYMSRVGLSKEMVDSLPIIHLAGTKGKGSTGAFCQSILKEYGLNTAYFNSPHLIDVRERFLLNGKPIEKNKFCHYFWIVYNALHQGGGDDAEMPFYFAFLTVLAFYVFLHEGTDVVILEVGLGGRYDSTNIVRTPQVCGVTALGFDHTDILGNTIEDIAWNKAGIFKMGVPAFTVEQHHLSSMDVLVQIANERQVPLSIVPSLGPHWFSSSANSEACFSNGCATGVLGIAGDVQLSNAALAVQLCRTFRFGLRRCYWPGRSQTIVTNRTAYFLDGAHTVDSMKVCVDWFNCAADEDLHQSCVKRCDIRRQLIFAITGKRHVEDFFHILKPHRMEHTGIGRKFSSPAAYIWLAER